MIDTSAELRENFTTNPTTEEVCYGSNEPLESASVPGSFRVRQSRQPHWRAARASRKEQLGLPKPPAGGVPKETFEKPSTKISGTPEDPALEPLRAGADTWFDKFVKDWGKKVGVDVRSTTSTPADVPGRIASEIQAGSGHDLIQHISDAAQFEPGVVDLKDVTEEANKRLGKQLEICKESSFNPNTGKYYAYAPGWVPDPGNYRKSLWSEIGMDEGPTTWDELLKGAPRSRRARASRWDSACRRRSTPTWSDTR